MKKIVFTEEFCQPEQLFPFTLTRQVQDIRVGILTIREKWERHLGMPSFDKYEADYKDLDRAIVLDQNMGDDSVYLIHGNILPTAQLVKAVKKLKPGECIAAAGREIVVYCISAKEITDPNRIQVSGFVLFEEEIKEIKYPWDITALNGWAIRQDFALLTKKRTSAQPDKWSSLIAPQNIFIEKGATLSHCIINASDGPVYIGKDAVLMEGTTLRGPVAVCDEAVIKMGARIYGATTIGPRCMAGGEIKNSVLFGNSNKAHDGYLGDAVIGEWCNLGAGTTASNVKNNASAVAVWTPKGEVTVGLKCGVIMGDHSRTAINTAVNTGTVIGVSCNVFGGGLTPKFIASFSWGADGIERYRFDKALADIENWKALKGSGITEAEKTILKHIFDHY